MPDTPEAGEPPLWKPVLNWLASAYLTSEPWIRDRARVDAVLWELYALGERPAVPELRRYLDELGESDGWAREVADRWRRRVRNPRWRPRRRDREGEPWVRPFYVVDRVVREHGLRSIPDRLADALTTAALDYMRVGEADPGAVRGSVEADVFALTTEAVYAWALTREPDAAGGHD